MKIDFLNIMSIIFFFLTFVPVATVMTGTFLTVIGVF